MQGEGNPVGYSVGGAHNEVYETEYKDIGTFDGTVIEIPPDADIGDSDWEGIGSYVVLDEEYLTPDIEGADYFFDESYFDNCPSEYETCLPVCADGRPWSEHMNEKIDEYGGFLLQNHDIDDDGVFTQVFFVVDDPWGGDSACRSTSFWSHSGDCYVL